MIPQFSLRQILLALIVVSLLVVCLAGAYRGALLPILLICGSLVFVAIMPLALAAVYWLGLVLSSVFSVGSRQSPKPVSVASESEPTS